MGFDYPKRLSNAIFKNYICPRGEKSWEMGCTLHLLIKSFHKPLEQFNIGEFLNCS